MLTRTHFAQMLISEGYCKDMKSVFRRYLTGKKPGGVHVEWKNIDEVISLDPCSWWKGYHCSSFSL